MFTGSCFNIKTIFPCIGILLTYVTLSWDCLVSIMRMPISVDMMVSLYWSPPKILNLAISKSVLKQCHFPLGWNIGYIMWITLSPCHINWPWKNCMPLEELRGIEVTGHPQAQQWQRLATVYIHRFGTRRVTDNNNTDDITSVKNQAEREIKFICLFGDRIQTFCFKEITHEANQPLLLICW